MHSNCGACAGSAGIVGLGEGACHDLQRPAVPSETQQQPSSQRPAPAAAPPTGYVGHLHPEPVYKPTLRSLPFLPCSRVSTTWAAAGAAAAATAAAAARRTLRAFAAGRQAAGCRAGRGED